MKPFLLSLVLLLGLSGGVSAQSADVEATIDAQIEAFLADDFDRAFTFASPTIQNMFRTPDNFGAMVQKGYPMVWRPSSVDYLDSREEGGRIWQKVQITDAAGDVYVLEYQMIELENGWKINGVSILEKSAVAA